MEFGLQIINFHNCEGCIRKVRIALRKLSGVEIVKCNPENGNFRVSTSEHDPHVIKYAPERKCKKKVIFLSDDVNPRDHNPNPVVPPQGTTIPTQGGVGFSTGSVSFNHGESQPAGWSWPEYRSGGGNVGDRDYLGYVPIPPPPPRSGTVPSAPLLPAAEEGVYGVSRTYRHDHQSGCCTIV